MKKTTIFLISCLLHLRRSTYPQLINDIFFVSSLTSSSHNPQLLLGLCSLVARYAPKHSWPLSPCVKRYSIEPCSRSTHSLIFGMSLCVHLPSFDESHSSCHLLKNVSLAFPSMMFLSSSGRCPCLRLRPYSTTFLSSQELAT